MLPVLGRDVVEGQLSIPVFGQTFDRLVILGSVGLDEEVEGVLGIGPGLGDPDVLEMGFRLALKALGQLVEHVGGLVDPAALLAGLAVDLAERRPETECAVAHGQFRRNRQPPGV